MTEWRKRVFGGLWILATVGLWLGACTTRDAWSMPFFELALPATISLLVGTFVPGAQDWLPWGRAWKRFQERRVRHGIAEMEKELEEGERIEVAGVPYRGGVEVRTRMPKKRRDRRWAVALIVGGLLTIVLTLAVRGFLVHRDLTMVTLVSGLLATIVLSLSSMRDMGRAEAKAKLRIEEGVREMEAQHVRIGAEPDFLSPEIEEARAKR